MVKEEDILNLSKTLQELRKDFFSESKTKNLYNFFKKEIKPKLAYIDNSPTQIKADEPKRKYVGGFWNAILTQEVQTPWVRIGASDELVPTLELIVSEDEQIPKVDLEVDALGNIGYIFKMGIEYSYSTRPELLVETVIKSVTAKEYKELLNIANKFHEKVTQNLKLLP